MVGLVFRTFMFFSSYIPIFIMIFLNNLNSFSTKAIIRTWNINCTLWIAMIIISIISLLALTILICCLKKSYSDKSKKKYCLAELQRYDSEVLSFFVTFIIPILSLKPESLPSIAMNLILVITYGIYYISNNALHFNIILIIIGYHVYTFENDNIVISRKKIDQLVGKQASQLGTTNFFYV